MNTKILKAASDIFYEQGLNDEVRSLLESIGATEIGAGCGCLWGLDGFCGGDNVLEFTLENVGVYNEGDQWGINDVETDFEGFTAAFESARAAYLNNPYYRPWKALPQNQSPRSAEFMGVVDQRSLVLFSCEKELAESIIDRMNACDVADQANVMSEIKADLAKSTHSQIHHLDGFK